MTQGVLGDVIRTLYGYNAWANDRGLDTAGRITPEQFVAGGGASVDSVRDTLVHAMSVQWLYPERWQGSLEAWSSMTPAGSERPSMATEEERCAEAKKFQRIDDAFREGDLDRLRAAVDDPAVVPNGLARNLQPLHRRLRSGLTLLTDIPGAGEPVRRQHHYRIRLRLWLNTGQPVRWKFAWGPVDVAKLDDQGETLVTEARIDRRSLISGLFYGVEGMRVGGTRRLEIEPHLAYGDRGVPGVVPAGARLTAEIAILEARNSPRTAP